MSHLRELLNQLPQLLECNSSDLSKFNEGVEDIINSLDARGEEPGPDLGQKLFKAYLTTSNSEFVQYINCKKDKFDEHESSPALYTDTNIMALARNKYLRRVDEGVWNKPSQEQEKIIALQAEAKQLKGSARCKTTEKDGKKKESDKKKDSDDKKKKQQRDKPAWMLERGDGPAHKTVKGNEYHWCPKHKAWTRHKPEECRLEAESTEGNNAEPTEGGSNEPQIRLFSALNAVLTE